MHSNDFDELISRVTVFKSNGLRNSKGKNTEYYQMPPMARFDEYERCILGYENTSAYCIVKTAIKPNPELQLWNYIKNFSDDTMHHFRHDILTTGICINWCRKKLAKLDEITYNELYEPYFDAHIKYPINPDDFEGTREYREMYGDDVNRCINLYLKDEYNLTGYSEINFCNTNKEVEENDILDYIFIAITLFIFITVLIATIYDYRLRNRTNLSNSLKSSRKREFLLAFSVISNWERLTSIPKSGIVYEFRHIQGCMPHAWYMAADTQLFTIGMFILMLVWKCPRYTKHLIMGSTAIFCLIPGIITYIKGYDGVFTVPPEDRVNMNRMPSFKDTYVTFYTSAGNYFIGILAGYLYHVINRSTYQPSQRTRTFLRYTFIHFEKPALWIAIYAIISKNMWGYIGTFFMFTFYCKAVPPVSRFLNARIFQTLGRITYCVYLAHFSLLRIASAEGRGPAVVKSLTMFGYSTLGLIYSSFIGLTLCLCLEFPITALLKMLLPERKGSDEISDEMKEMGVEAPLKNKFDYYNNVNKADKQSSAENGFHGNIDDNNNNA
uniref:CSON014430 protein n=1 Tax=Culicoides sonorensis TaxID=179676 RepID=A0A336LLI2_CULSO